MKALLLCAFFASALATDGWLVVNEDNDHFFKLVDLVVGASNPCKERKTCDD
jgi:hypothetical protein